MSFRSLFASAPIRSLHTSSFLQKNTGNVKWFNSAKGFGFITSSEGKDVFVHYASINSSGFRSLREGEAVEFEVRSRSFLSPSINLIHID